MALNEFMSRQVRRKQQPEFNPGLVPGIASFSPLPRRTRILIIHTSLPLHFISYCCLSSLHCHLHPCDLCSPALPAPGLRTTPGQPREFYAHTMKRFSHLSSHRPGPLQAQPPGRVTMPSKRQRISRQNVWFNWLRGWLWYGGTLNGLVWFIVCHVELRMCL